MPARPAITVDDRTKAKRFDDVCIPHLNAAYNLALWLARDERNAEDIVQEACLRAYRFIDGCNGSSGRAWLLTIVRNTFYTWLEKNRGGKDGIEFDQEELAAYGYDIEALENHDGYAVDQALEQEESRAWVNRALECLPAKHREIIVLRELEELSYKEIASVTGVPVGTVMSRLARAREMLRRQLEMTTEV